MEPIVAYLATAVTSNRTHAMKEPVPLKGRSLCGVPVYTETHNGQPIPITPEHQPDCLTCRRLTNNRETP